VGLVEEGGEKVERSGLYQAIPKPSTLKRRLRVVRLQLCIGRGLRGRGTGA